jgi:hypothetical protein
MLAMKAELATEINSSAMNLQRTVFNRVAEPGF